MKNLSFTILFFALFQITGAETFKSHSTIMMTRDSVDIKTKKIFWWTDWSYTLPEDGSHRLITVKKRKVTFDRGDVYTLERNPKKNFAQYRNQFGVVFCYKATDQNGKRWIVTICRGDSIYAIQIEDSNKIIVYQ